jgi:hypothetical protein
MGKEPHASAQEHTKKEHAERERPETSDHRKGEQRKGGRRGHRKHPARRDGTPAPVTRLDEVRPHRAPKPTARAGHGDDGGHLPAFLLRPFRVKA